MFMMMMRIMMMMMMLMMMMMMIMMMLMMIITLPFILTFQRPRNRAVFLKKKPLVNHRAQVQILVQFLENRPPQLKKKNKQGWRIGTDVLK